MAVYGERHKILVSFMARILTIHQKISYFWLIKGNDRGVSTRGWCFLSKQINCPEQLNSLISLGHHTGLGRSGFSFISPEWLTLLLGCKLHGPWFHASIQTLKTDDSNVTRFIPTPKNRLKTQ